jgi:hypothetical protein
MAKKSLSERIQYYLDSGLFAFVIDGQLASKQEVRRRIHDITQAVRVLPNVVALRTGEKS